MCGPLSFICLLVTPLQAAQHPPSSVLPCLASVFQIPVSYLWSCIFFINDLGDNNTSPFPFLLGVAIDTYPQEWAYQVALVVKNLPANAGDLRDTGLIPGSRRSPGGQHGNPLQHSCLENPHEQRSLEVCSSQAHKESDMCAYLWELSLCIDHTWVPTRKTVYSK